MNVVIGEATVERNRRYLENIRRADETRAYDPRRGNIALLTAIGNVPSYGGIVQRGDQR